MAARASLAMNAAILILSAILGGYIMASLCWLWYVLRENWRLTMRVAELEGHEADPLQAQ